MVETKGMKVLEDLRALGVKVVALKMGVTQPLGLISPTLRHGCREVVCLTCSKWRRQGLLSKPFLPTGRPRHCWYTLWSLTCWFLLCRWLHLSGWVPVNLILLAAGLQNTVLLCYILTLIKNSISKNGPDLEALVLSYRTPSKGQIYTNDFMPYTKGNHLNEHIS